MVLQHHELHYVVDGAEIEAVVDPNSYPPNIGVKRSLPKNHNQPWSAEQVSCVIRRFNNGDDLSDIARYMGRTDSSIFLKLKSLYPELNNRLSYEGKNRARILFEYYQPE